MFLGITVNLQTTVIISDTNSRGSFIHISNAERGVFNSVLQIDLSLILLNYLTTSVWQATPTELGK